MAANSYVDPADLATMSRSPSPIEQMGYDPEEARANPQIREAIRQRASQLFDMGPNSQMQMQGSGVRDQGSE